MTGKRLCGCASASRWAREAVIAAGRNSTSGRGTITSRTCLSSASKTSAIMRRSTLVSDSCAATRDCNSSEVISAPVAFGSPPSSRTITFVDLPSSQTTGRNNRASSDSGPDANSAIASRRCSPIRLGVSSPSTSEKKEMTSVVPTSPMVPAAPSAIPRRSSQPATRAEMVAAPNADESMVATVTPICTAARKRLGSETSRSSRRPRAPRVAARCRTCDSRSEIIEISAALKQPPIRMNRTTTPMSTRKSFIGSPGRGQPARRPVAQRVHDGLGSAGRTVAPRRSV